MVLSLRMLLECKNLNIVFKKRKFSNEIIKNVNFASVPNEITLIIGSSGSGKSLLFSHFAGLVEQKGEIKVFDELSGEYLNVRDVLFCLPTTSILFETLTVKENIEFYICDREKISKTLKNLFNFSENLLSKYPNKLSQGERKIVSFLIAFYSNKEIILVDEAYADIDKENIEKLNSLLLTSNKSFIIFDHEKGSYDGNYSKLYEINNKGLNLVEERTSKEKRIKENCKFSKKNDIHFFYILKLILSKKRFLLNDFLTAVLAALMGLTTNLLINLSFLSVEENFITDKLNLFNTYLGFCLGFAGFFILFSIIFKIFWTKAYRKEINLLKIRNNKKSEYFVFCALNEIISFFFFSVLFFSLLYFFDFRLTFLLNENFYSSVNFRDFLLASSVISIFAVGFIYFVFVLFIYLFNFEKKHTNFFLEEN